MKKEKTIKSYQRRTKSGKVVTVRQHTAKYEASDKKEASRKDGAGDEMTQKKLDATRQKIDTYSDYGFTADEYKVWYHWDQDADPKNATAKKVEKALKKQMGTKAYNRYFDEMSDNYSSRGHNKAFKGLGEKFSTGEKKSVTSKSIGDLAHPTEWSRSMREKYSGSTGRDAEVASLLGVKHSLRLAPTGYTKGAIQTAIRELKKVGDTKKVKSLEKLLALKEKKTSSKSPSLESLEAEGYIPFKAYGKTLYIGKREKPVYMKDRKGKITKVDNDACESLLYNNLGHNGLSKKERKKFKSLGWHDPYEED